MSRQTKAELEAENKWLRFENDSLRELLRDTLDELNRCLHIRKIEDKVHTSTIALLVQKSDDLHRAYVDIMNARENAISESTRHAAQSKRKMKPEDAKKYVDAKLKANPHMSLKEAFRQVAKKHLGNERSWNAVKRSYEYKIP